MWNKSDIIALLQLLTMVVFATVHAAWCLFLHQCKSILAQVLCLHAHLTRVNLRRRTLQPHRHEQTG
jgi:hypothetical protein